MEAFLPAFAVVFLAELGDKSQLLALTFATKYNWQLVMSAIFASTFANHFLAVLAGTYLGSLLEPRIMQIIASVAFIGFGIWTIRGDELDDEPTEAKFSPFWTVAMAFFLAEMGDKTQFATITMAAGYQSFLPVLMGTTLGMVLADGFGVIAGIVLHKTIPERTIKWIAAAVFIGCGVMGLYLNI